MGRREHSQKPEIVKSRAPAHSSSCFEDANTNASDATRKPSVMIPSPAGRYDHWSPLFPLSPPRAPSALCPSRPSTAPALRCSIWAASCRASGPPCWRDTWTLLCIPCDTTTPTLGDWLTGHHRAANKARAAKHGQGGWPCCILRSNGSHRNGDRRRRHGHSRPWFSLPPADPGHQQAAYRRDFTA